MPAQKFSLISILMINVCYCKRSILIASSDDNMFDAAERCTNQNVSTSNTLVTQQILNYGIFIHLSLKEEAIFKI